LLDRFRAGVIALTIAGLVGGASAPSDSLGATAGLSPLAAPLEIKTSGTPFGIAIDAQSGRAYVTDLKEDTLFVFDVAGGAALAYIPTGHQPHQVVLSGTEAFVSNFAASSITVIDTSTNRRLKELGFGGLGLALNRQTNRLYAAAGSHLSVIDTATDALVETIVAPAGANLWGVAVDTASNRIYATDIANPRVLVYDGKSNALVAEVAIDAPARFGIAVGAAGRVFVASYTDNNPQLSVIDGPSAKVVARVPIAAFTTSLVADPLSGVVYALSGSDRSVTAINPVVGGTSRVSVTQTPGGLAINPATNELIVVTPGGAAPPSRLPVDQAPVTKP
jgi:YVTN family beta-propeller protein